VRLKDTHLSADSDLGRYSLLAIYELGSLAVEELETSISAVSWSTSSTGKTYVKLLWVFTQSCVILLDEEPSNLILAKFGVVVRRRAARLNRTCNVTSQSDVQGYCDKGPLPFVDIVAFRCWKI
jgi:hypothetical protein